MAKRSTKLIALLLTLIMVCSLLPIGAVAVGPELPEVTVAHTGDKVSNSSSEGNEVTAQKTIEKVSGTKDEFLVTLDVTTNASKEIVSVPADADVVIVLDMSGSMCKAGNDLHYHGNCTSNKCAIVDAQNAAIAFTNNFLGGEYSGTRRIGLVAFGGSNVLGTSPRYFESGLNANKDEVKASIRNDKTYAYGGTPTGDALYKAKTMLAASTATYKYVILLTDGMPTLNSKDPKEYAKNAANSVKDAGIELYAIGCNTTSYSVNSGNNFTTLENWMKTICTQPASTYYRGVSSEGLELTFQNISTEINKAAQGWYVEDPMSSYVTFKGFTNQDSTNYYQSGTDTAAATESDAAIRWNLLKVNPISKTTAGTVTTNHYKLQYIIKANCDAAFYNAIKDKAAGTYQQGDVTGLYTNGTTTLHYYLKDDNTVVTSSLDFDLPAVTSVMPTVPYSVEFYKKSKTDGQYQLQSGDTENKTGTYGDSVTLESLNIDKDSKYANDNYSFDHGDTSITLGLSGNVMKIYYDPIPASVKVNYFYKTTTTDVNNVTTETESYATSKATSTISNGLFVGDEYTLTPSPKDGGYTLDKTQDNSNLKINSLSATPSENVINLYYSRAVDERVSAGVQVIRAYTYTQWDAANFRYKAPVTTTLSDPIVSGYKQYDSHSTSTAPGTGYENYTFDGTTGSTNSVTTANNQATMVLEKANNDNVIKLNYSYKDPEPAKIAVTVNHIYTKTTSSVNADGEVTYVNNPDNVTGSTETLYAYPGQPCTAQGNKTDYQGDTYAVDAASKTIAAVSANDKTINFFYTLSDNNNLIPATLTVKYEYYLREMAIDADGNHYYKADVPEKSGTDKTYPTSGSLYVGQYVNVDNGADTAYPKAYGDNPGTRVMMDSASKTITFKYYRISDLSAANVTVNHHYTLTAWTVDNGVLTKHVSEYDGTSDTAAKYVGETYTANQKPTLNGKTYTLDKANSDELSLTVKAGENTIDLKYTLTEYPQEAAAVTVNYKYFTVDYDGTESEVSGLANTVKATSYSGVEYTATSGEKDGYTLSSKTAAPNGFKDGTELTIVLAAGQNTIDLVYKKTIDSRTPSAVTVNHIYRLGTTAQYTTEGTYTETLSADVYAGFNFTATERLQNSVGENTYNYTFDSADPSKTIKVSDTATNNVIDLYYYRTAAAAPVDPVTPPPYVGPVQPNDPVQPTDPADPDEDIDDPDVPTTDAPADPADPADPGDIEIPDDGVPLANAPAQRTGDTIVFWLIIAGISCAALVTIIVYDRKRKN